MMRLATTDAEIAACHPVMSELRPHVRADQFVSTVRHQQQAGYCLAYGMGEAGTVVAVAGFRIGHNLAWGRFLYVDDLVTATSQRSRGYGAAALAWLKGYAAEHGCRRLHLDSGTQRDRAHRFYEREGMTVTSLHFACDVPVPPTAASPGPT